MTKSTNKLAFQIILWGSALIFAGGLLRNGARAFAQDHPLDGVSVVLQEVVTKPDGSKFNSATYRFATNVDGSMVFVPGDKPASVEEPVRIVQLASGLRGYISDVHHQKAVRTAASGGSLRLPSASCTMPAAHDRAVGVEQIAGYRAEKVVLGNTASWYSLDYSCALLREHFDWQDGSKSDKYLLLLRPGAPDSSLFAVPANYSDVPESAFWK